MTRALVARLDSDGDVLVSGPTVRAVAAGVDEVVLLVGPRGAAAAHLLPGVDRILTWSCPWIEHDPQPVDAASTERLVADLRDLNLDRALVLTSYHQSPLPLALLLRLAGVPWIGAVSEDYPGALLDLRHRVPATGLHEVERQLSLAEAAGLPLPDGDDGSLQVRRPLPDLSALTGNSPYVVVHPGSAVPARAPSSEWTAALVRGLAAAGHRVVVTGGPTETALSAYVAGDVAVDIGGRTDFAGLADVLDRADVVVAGNTGPAHLAAAVATPVVSLFAPVVPAERWRPWRVAHVLLGDQSAACAGTRARLCPLQSHTCLDTVAIAAVLDAVRELTCAGAPEMRASHLVEART